MKINDVLNEAQWQTPGLKLEPMSSTKQRDLQRQQGLRPTGPQRLMSELADMLHISVGQLTWLAQQIPGFPQVRGRHSSSQGNKGYYDLAAFKRWVIDNQIREKIAAKQQGVAEDLRTENPCWKGYHPVGTKKKAGRTVPNCVPNANEGVAEDFDSGEYSDEAGMAQGNLISIARAAQGLLDTIDEHEDLPEWVQEKIAKVEGMLVSAWNYLQDQEAQGIDPRVTEMYAGLTENWQRMSQRLELIQEFDLIESIVESIADRNGVDAELVWADLESLTEDELYVFAVTSEPVMENQGLAEGNDNKSAGQAIQKLQSFAKMNPDFTLSDLERLPSHGISIKQTLSNAIQACDMLKQQYLANKQAGNAQFIDNLKSEIKWFLTDRTQSQDPATLGELLQGTLGKINFQQGVMEDWQKANKKDKTDGMSRKAVKAYRREHPGSKLQTAVTTKPSKLKKGSKASKRRKSYCSRSRGQMKMHNISCAKTPDKAICKARRRWNC